MDIRFVSPSYKRAGQTATDKLFPFVTLAVSAAEADAYRAHTDNLLIMPSAVQGNIARVRNWLLDQHRDCDALIMLDDDLHHLGRFVGTKARKLTPDELLTFAEMAVTMARDSGCYLFGLNPLNDKGSYREFAPFSFLSPVLGPFSGHIPSPLRYDERIPLKEDYDFCIQHLNRYRRVLRFNAYHYSARQSVNKGGCATSRNLTNERTQFNLLQAKWGSKIVQSDTQSAKAFDYNPQADDYDVQFPTTDLPDDQTLQAYTGPDMTIDGSLSDWYWANIRERYVFDPNAVLLTLPAVTAEASTNAYPTPQPLLIPCENVLVFQKGKLAVLLSEEKNQMTTDLPGKPTGHVVYVVDHESYTVCRQTALTAATTGPAPYVAEWSVLGIDFVTNEADQSQRQVFMPALHYCGTLPAVKLGLSRKGRNGNGEDWRESMLADALPHVRLAQRNQSDIQVEVIFHVAAQEYRYTSQKCPNPDCNDGKVYLRSADKQEITGEVTCPVCKGRKLDITGSGLGMIWMDANAPDALGRTGPAVPAAVPGGFIPRDIEPLREFIREFERNTREAYSTINMQFIRNVADVQSGVAKLYDREEMYRELNTQAAHLCGLLQFLYACVDAQRFGPSGKAGQQLPQVLVPVRFNINNAEMTREELNNAKDKKYDSTLIEALESKMLLYITGENSDEYLRYQLRKKLNLYKDITPELKIFLMGVAFRNPQSEQNDRLIERYYLSVNFDGLVSLCLLEDPDFWTLDLKVQYDQLVAQNKLVVGPQATGLAAQNPDGSYAGIESVPLNPVTDMRQANQILQDNRG